jgi:L-aspartate oxidase
MLARHPLAELAPRDIVARGVFAEIAAGRGAFLDASKALGARFAEEFPTVYESCISAGIDPATQPIPIAPAAHYHMGGIAVDAHGRSSLKGLWAAGEVSSTGAHGANRLASNSLLEAVVYAARIAIDIAGTELAAPATRFNAIEAPRNAAVNPREEMALRQLMSSHVGVIRDGDRLADAVRRIAEIETSATSAAMLNMATAALLVATAAWNRRESRGAQFRSDYPAENPVLADRTMTSLVEAREIAASLAGGATVRQLRPLIA